MSDSSKTTAKRLEIKKYPNRRYYDATHSRHLTLDEIRSLIQQGYDLRVVDAKTSADITAQVLTQIILELDTAKLDSLPIPLLLRLIRMNDQLIKDFIDKYFNQALHSFLGYQEQLEEQMRRAHGLPSAFPSVSAWTKAMFEPLASAFGGGAAPPSDAAPAVGASTEELLQMIQQLQKELAELKPSPRRKGHRSARGAKRAS